jgi:hypothetical protein
LAAELSGCAVTEVDPAAAAVQVAASVLGDDGGTPLVQYQRELVRTLASRALSTALADGRS